MDTIINVASFWLTQAWRFFSEIDVPGTGISVGTLFLGVFLIGFSVKLLNLVLGFLSVKERGSNDK